jgi:small subunit ribosomal protein S17
MEKNRKSRVGRIVSNKMDKTVVIQVESLRRHPLYHKVIRHVSKFKAHDEDNSCNTGDVVRIVETRPLSRDKRWKVVEIVQKKETVEAVKDELAQVNQEK